MTGITRTKMCSPGLALAVMACVALIGAGACAQEPATVVIADFETGVGAWLTNDGHVDGARPSDICGIYAIERPEGDHTEQAALIEFKAARNTWASVRLPVSGQTWLEHDAGQIAMWLRGDGSDNTVDLTLRALVGQPRRDVSYVYKLSLENSQWERRAIRLFAFKNAEGQPIDGEALRGVYLIQFVKTGSWPHITFQVDDIRAEPVPGVTLGGGTTPPSLSATVDFRKVVGPMLTRVGANLGPDLTAVLDDRSASQRASASLREIAPCLVRLRLSDFYRPVPDEYDLVRVNRTLNWIADSGARPLICLSPGAAPATADPAASQQQFIAAAVKLVSLRRGGSGVNYYEIFDSPLLTGRFADVAGLVAGYNDMARRVLAADPEARVGGPGLASPWGENVEGFLRGAETLHFLSFSFHGAHTSVAATGALFEAAVSGVSGDLPQQLSLAEVAGLARTLRRPMPELLINAISPSSADGRDAAFAAAWTAAVVLSASPCADRMLSRALMGDLLGPDGAPLPAYWAVSLVRSYAPRGSVLCELTRPDPDLLIAAVWTAASRNVIAVYGGQQPRSLVVDCWGTGSPLLVRGRQLMATGEVRSSDRSITPQQAIDFDGPGVAAIEFVTDQ